MILKQTGDSGHPCSLLLVAKMSIVKVPSLDVVLFWI